MKFLAPFKSQGTKNGSSWRMQTMNVPNRGWTGEKADINIGLLYRQH